MKHRFKESKKKHKGLKIFGIIILIIIIILCAIYLGAMSFIDGKI